MMDWRDVALIAAGIIGASTAAVHGIVVQRLMVTPIRAMFRTDRKMSAPVLRIVPLLLHFSTLGWFLGGLALIFAALATRPEARLATCLFVGSLYLFGALGNLWATRGRHPGWMLMAAALILIAIGADTPGGS